MWDRYKKYLFHSQELGLMIDISQVPFPEDFFPTMADKMAQVYRQMAELEKGAIANPDEARMVGHYWLRRPELAPEENIAREIRDTIKRVKEFAEKIHAGVLKGEKGRWFKNFIVIGIGGSSLGPRFVSAALGNQNDRLKAYFIDNTDPDGIDRVFTLLEGELDRTLVIVISKSGGTVETRNGMAEARFCYQEKGLDFAMHTIGITQAGSKLDKISKEEGWLATFPMWDWVGGRTSVLSAVGLLPLALQGLEIEQLLAGARACDELSRREELEHNPAALLVLMWYWLTGGQGGKQMVMLPYKDRLELLTKYLQQLIMESLGKEKDLEGRVVNQGIAVLGNKGSTDQHSYMQQLLEGPDNFFVTFIQVLKDRDGCSQVIAENSTSGDYLQAFLMGTRKALTMKGRPSITITIDQINSFTMGMLLSLFERTVSMYAFLVNINAYHQPGVELGKKGADEIITLKNQVLSYLGENLGRKFSVEELAQEMGQQAKLEDLFQLLLHLGANPDHGVQVGKNKDPFLAQYWI